MYLDRFQLEDNTIFPPQHSYRPDKCSHFQNQNRLRHAIYQIDVFPIQVI